MGERRAEVLVVGAGPVGLASALFLAKKGIRVELIDEQWRAAARSYALALHPSSLERLDELGLADDLVRAGNRIDTIAFYDGSERTGNVSLQKLEAKFPFVLALAQSSLEDALAKALRQRNVAIQWNRRLAALNADGKHPVAEVETLEKESSGYGVARTQWAVQSVERVEASFVIGADGHRSVVRRELGVELEPTGPAQLFAVFEFSAQREENHEMRIVFDSAGTSVLWPLGAGRYRFSFAVPGDTSLRRQDKSRIYVHVDDEAFPHLGREQLEQLIRDRAPWFDSEIGEVLWGVGVNFERRVATRFGSRRVWLAGDAAHVGSPIGVYSMNRGIEEANGLSQAIARELREGDSTGGVQREAERFRTGWQSLSEVPAFDETAPSWVRQRASALMLCVPEVGSHRGAVLAQLGFGA